MALTDKHLLVVDDHAANVQLMLDLLEDHGFSDIHSLEDPRDVLGYCQAQRPDLLLLDIRMPHLDGYQVIEGLREHFGPRVPPIIVLTAQIDDQTRRRALELGVRDFLTKPFKHDEVLQRIENALEVEDRFEQRDDEAIKLERMVEARTRALQRQSRTDPVTQLLNRRGLSETLETIAESGDRIGILFIALHGLDAVAALHGHMSAERLFERLARALETRLAVDDRLGRWGGSELMLIAPTDDPMTLESKAAQLHSACEDDIAVGDLLLPVALRIGISTAARGFDPERLVQMAALSTPPLGSERSSRHHDASIEYAERERLALQQALKGAHARGEMHLAFQPKIALNGERITGAEALLRWHHPELGPVSPGVFIPLAEASGDILDIGDWVIDMAITQAKRWQTAPWAPEGFDLAINVATRQLSRPDFAQRLLDRLDAASLGYDRISIEITESGLMEDLQHARTQLDMLADHGVRVAIDDFGTGQSSLAYLRALRFSTLKIDRSFVMELPENETDRHLAGTITRLAHGLGCQVVAEGIEHGEQADYLHTIGCETGQGFYYARPMTAEALVEWYG